MQALASVGLAGVGSICSELLPSIVSERCEEWSPLCPAVVRVSKVGDEFGSVAESGFANWAVGALYVVVRVGALFVHSAAVCAHASFCM